MKKKLLSTILAAAMLFTSADLSTVTVYADETQEQSSGYEDVQQAKATGDADEAEVEGTKEAVGVNADTPEEVDENCQMGTSDSGIELYSSVPTSYDEVTHADRFASYTKVKGIDVSRHQGTIDWNKVKAAGVDFAIIRAAYRTYQDSGNLFVDQMAKQNIQGAKNAGIKVGVYIYSQAVSVPEGIEEADYIIDQLGGEALDLPVVLDYEFYTDGRLAPCWGYQIDETASVVFGVYEHYKYTNSEKFLKDNLQMCEKATDFLKRYVKDWVESAFRDDEQGIDNSQIDSKDNLQAHKYHVSYDLWEMCEGVHLYSLASIYSAFTSMLKIYDVLGKDVSDFENNRLKQEKVEKSKKEIEKLQLEIKKYINKYLYDEEKKSYVRNSEDKKMDISIVGAVTPFEVFKPKEKKVQNTIERINLSLRTYTGGYQRFENDNYMNGNPWPIANLWMTLYYLETGEKKKAKETFDFVIKTAGKHYFLGEQVNNETLKPNWVIGLGWSHAMFIIVLEKYMGK